MERKYYLFLLKIMKNSAFPIRLTEDLPHRLAKLLGNSMYCLGFVGFFLPGGGIFDLGILFFLVSLWSQAISILQC